MTLSFRQMTPADIAAVDALLIAAYASSRSFQEELNLYLALQPDEWFVALQDETPVGAGGMVNYGTFASIGLVGIRPDLQRRGIGQALMEHLLAQLAHAHCPIALLEASAAGETLYRKLGFQEEDTTIAFQLNRPPPSPPIRKNTIESLQPADLAELLALDEPYFGADRSHVFSAYLAAYPGRCFVSRHAQGHVTGYIIGQSDSLGPWLAQSHQEAEALLAYALTLPFQSAPRIRAPASNQQAVELMQTYGFAEVRRLRHMRRGGTRSPQQRACIYALATAAIG